jgi:hypothetical protein
VFIFFFISFSFFRSKKAQLEGEIFDLLYTLTDFMAFKSEMLEFKAFKEGRVVDLSSGISITSIDATNSSGASNGSVF